MKNLWASPVFRSRYLLAIVAGLLLAASFPRISLAGLAWVAPALMLSAALGKSGWESFRIGYVAGTAHYLASLYWLLLIPYRWHSIPLGPAAGWLALSAYLALYPATWVWVMAEGDRREKSWSQRTLWAISGAAVWVALEMLVARLFSGFPWNLLGASQYQMLPLIQLASVTGVYGVSFMVVWVSLSLMSAVVMIIRRPALRSVWIGDIILPFVVAAAVFSFGLRQLRPEPPAARTLKLALVQPSIPQTVIWDESKGTERFRDLLQLSEEALTNRPDLVVWPEAAAPSLARLDTNISPVISDLAREHHTWLILGSDDIGWPAEPKSRNDYEIYNSAFLVNQEGKFAAGYRKRNLVIFGEYIPLARWLPIFKFFTPIQGGFTPGERPVAFELTDLRVKASSLICFEDVFPQLVREYADEDTDFLVNLTNNGWFGEGAAQWQHAASAIFRAIENGLPLVRCSNNGVTCWVDERGRLRQVFRDYRGSVYGVGFMTAEIPLLGTGEKRVSTFYHERGDWFGWGCVGIAAATLLSKVARWIRARKV